MLQQQVNALHHHPRLYCYRHHQLQLTVRWYDWLQLQEVAACTEYISTSYPAAVCWQIRTHHSRADSTSLASGQTAVHVQTGSNNFNVLQNNNPMYLCDVLTTHNPSHNLRSSSQHLLSVGYVGTVSSSRCFKHSAAIDWNDLPFDIRACDSINVFKRKLKTHLFNIAFAT